MEAFSQFMEKCETLCFSDLWKKSLIQMVESHGWVEIATHLWLSWATSKTYESQMDITIPCVE